MIMCVSAAVQAVLQPLLPAATWFSHFPTLMQQLCQQAAQADISCPLWLELDLIDTTHKREAMLKQLHTLCGERLVVLASPGALAELTPHSLEHIQNLVSLPLASAEVQLVLRQRAEHQRWLQQQEASEQRLLQLMDDNRRLREHLQEESSHDSETGLLHRRGLTLRLEEEWRRAHRHTQPLAAIAVEIRGEQPCHPALLQALAHRLNAVRSSDVVARYDGQQFVLLLPLTFLDGAQALTAHFRSQIQHLLQEHGRSDLRAVLACAAEIPRSHTQAAEFLQRLLASCSHSAPSREALLI